MRGGPAGRIDGRAPRGPAAALLLACCCAQAPWLAGSDACLGDTSVDEPYFDLRIPPSPVPTARSSYHCANVGAPAASELELEDGGLGWLHATAFQQLAGKGNDSLAHHMLLFGCSRAVEPSAAAHPCQLDPRLLTSGCTELIVGHALSTPRICMPREAGVRIATRDAPATPRDGGWGGFRSLLIQVHWENPLRRSDVVDGQSGFRVSYTRSKRQHDAGLLTVGQGWFAVPPRTDSTSVCTPFPAGSFCHFFRPP